MTPEHPQRSRHNQLSYKTLVAVFNDCFLHLHGCRLESGHSEPLYLPASKNTPARVCFREDFASSALHEVAHWCIAGQARRQQVDFGYWYEPDGRNASQQRAFEQVEVRPQALEWLFSLAAGIRFCISVDNLGGEITDSRDFQRAVARQARAFVIHGLPERAQIFLDALRARTGCGELSINCFPDS